MSYCTCTSVWTRTGEHTEVCREITSLRAEVERLREALRGLVESVEYEDAPPLSGALKQARAALAGKAEP